jgi:hypothetical protein
VSRTIFHQPTAALRHSHPNAEVIFRLILIPLLLSLGFLPALGVAAQPWPDTPYQQPAAEQWNGPPTAKTTPCDERCLDL